jgi:hypothetical protein
MKQKGQLIGTKTSEVKKILTADIGWYPFHKLFVGVL